MGNVCGCVRGPKEECYVDPNKAPLRPQSRELKGRRYFQRKKRKSDISQPVEPFHNPRCEPLNDPEGNVEESQIGLDAEAHSSRQESPSRGEVAVLILRDSHHRPHEKLTTKISTDGVRSGSTQDKKPQDISTASRAAAAGEGLSAKKRGRSVSLGAVERTPQTLRVSDRSGNEDAVAKIICGSQANRTGRGRASSCSGYTQHYPVCAHHKVNLWKLFISWLSFIIDWEVWRCWFAATTKC